MSHDEIKQKWREASKEVPALLAMPDLRRGRPAKVVPRFPCSRCNDELPADALAEVYDGVWMCAECVFWHTKIAEAAS